MSCEDVETTLEERVAALERLAIAQANALTEAVKTIEALSQAVRTVARRAGASASVGQL